MTSPAPTSRIVTDLRELAGAGYGAILADPAWAFLNYSPKGGDRSAEKHYRTMTIDDIAALPVEATAAKDCHLFMWITGPMLVRGDHLRIMDAWGFKPSSMAFVWIKATKRAFDNGKLFGFLDERSFAMGLGHTTRQNAEYVALGRRGSPKRIGKGVHQIIVEPRRQHSRKPDEIYRRIETYCRGPYLEMNARQAWPGWDAWGDEAGKFEAVA